MKLLKLIGLCVLLLAVVGLLARNQLIKMEARRLIAQQTGFQLQIGKLKTSLLSSRVELLDVVVKNPPDFPEPVAFVISRAVVDVNPWALFRRETHLTEMVMEIPRVVVVRNEKGETNLQRMSAAAKRAGDREPAPAPQPTPAPAPEPAPAPQPKPERPLKIDRLKLHIGTVEYHDYRAPEPPAVTKLNLNVNKERENITNVSEIGTTLVSGVMESAAGQLFGDLGRSLQKAAEDENLRKEVKKIGKDLKRAFEGMFNGSKGGD